MGQLGMTAQAAVYSDLKRLNGWQFHVKHFKLGHQQRVLAQVGGASHTPRKGRGMEFSEVRQYQPGDDVRHIDWRVSARSQKTHTKLFTEEHERPIVFIVEQTPSLFFASQTCLKSVLALDIMSILAWAALNQGDRVGGLIFGQTPTKWIEPKRQAKTLNQLFHQALVLNHNLTQPGLVNHQAWWHAIKSIAPHIHPASRIILIGDMFSLNQTAMNQLQTLARHSVINAIHLQDPIEENLPQKSGLGLSDGQKQTVFDGFNQTEREAYFQSYHQAWLQLKHDFLALKTPLVSVSTHQNPVETLAQFRLLRR